MRNYDVILMDADDTLFDFSAAERQALKSTMERWSLPFSEEILRLYDQINRECWQSYEQGRVEKDEMLRSRFYLLFERLKITANPDTFNYEYLTALGEGSQLLPGAYELCKALYSRQYPLYIATNGVARTQKSRVKQSQIAPFFEGLFISETIGHQKPKKEFFDAVFQALSITDPRRVILLGDSLTSDMTGGKNAGLVTCWIAPEGADDGGIGCDYQISELAQFLKIVSA